MQPLLERPPFAAERAQPEHPADDGRFLEQLLLLGRQRVEAGGDDPLDRLGKDDFVRPRLEHARELLRVERIAARVREQPRLKVGVDRRPPEQRVQECRRLLLGERRQQDRRRVDLAAAPVGATRQQLGPGGAEDQQRHAARPVDEVVDEVEQRVVGPVQVLEDEDERALVGDRLEEAAPGREGLVAAVARCLVGVEPGERAQAPLDPCGVGRIVDESLDRLAKLLPRPRLGPSDSRIPACALTISPSAQNVTPSPYGSERPCRQ